MRRIKITREEENIIVGKLLELLRNNPEDWENHEVDKAREIHSWR